MMRSVTQTFPVVSSVLYVLPVFALCPAGYCFAQHARADSNPLPFSSAVVRIPGTTTFKPSYSTVEWEGKEYNAADGTDVLMQVVTSPVAAGATRAKALQRLARFRNKEITAPLVALYANARGREEKLGIIQCLIASEDPHGFPLFVRVLENETDSMVRLFAAIGLTQWNVRSGVAELMRTLEKCKDIASADRDVCIEAANEFSWFNAHKGWAFPEEEIRKSIMEKTDLDDNEKFALFVTELKKWWVENEQRFPDWKPGDPLPATDGNESATPANP